MLFCRNGKGKILFIEFVDVTNSLACHMLDFPQAVDGCLPMMLQSLYDSDEDGLYLKFVEDQKITSTLHDSNYEIMLDQNEQGKFIGIEIQSASEILCKNLKKL